MKQYYILLILIPFFGFGQCPPDGVFNTQAEIDAFAIDYPNCLELDYLNIEGDDITDLSPFLQLEFNGSLIIKDTSLTNLQGLNNVQNSVDSDFFLIIENNDSLTSISSLLNISSLSGFTIKDNQQLTTLEGLSMVTNLDGFDQGIIAISKITNNSSLVDISAFSSMTNSSLIDLLVIRDNPSLQSLNGLQGIGEALTLVIENNDMLTNFEGLNNYQNADDFYVADNDNLISFAGLDNLSAGNIAFINNDAMVTFEDLNMVNPHRVEIIDNDMLENIDGFIFNQGGGNNVTITGNPNLSICNTEYMCSMIEAQKSFNISNNALECNTVFEVAEQCGVSFNDDCFGNSLPEIIIGEPIQANTSFATTSANAPSCNDEDREDVWFRFNSGDLESINITVTTGFSIQLWEGVNCNDLSLVSNACATDELQNIVVTSSTNYYLQVWQYPNNRTTLQGDFEILVTDESLSVSANALETIQLYPNPSSGKLTIKGISNGTLNSIKIYSILGKHVGDYLNAPIDISNFESGVYFIKIVTDLGTVTKRVIKE